MILFIIIGILLIYLNKTEYFSAKSKARKAARKKKKAEKKAAKKDKKEALDECKGLSGKEKRDCKKSARKDFRQAKKDARKEFRDEKKKIKNINKYLYDNLLDSNNREIDNINKRMDRLKNVLNKPNTLFKNVANSCSVETSYKLKIRYELFTLLINIITVIFFVLIIFKIINSPTTFFNKFFKLLSFNVTLPIVMLCYVIYKLAYPFLKTNVLNDDDNKLKINENNPMGKFNLNEYYKLGYEYFKIYYENSSEELGIKNLINLRDKIIEKEEDYPELFFEYKDNNFDDPIKYTNPSDIINEYFKIQTKMMIEDIKKLNSNAIPNSYIIKYILNKGENIDKESGITLKEYIKYLFTTKEFKIMDLAKVIKLARIPGPSKLNANEHKFLKEFNNTPLWKNMIIEKLDFESSESNGILRHIKYYILMIIIYNWAPLFDYYDSNEHISHKYDDIVDKFKN